MRRELPLLLLTGVQEERDLASLLRNLDVRISLRVARGRPKRWYLVVRVRGVVVVYLVLARTKIFRGSSELGPGK